MTTAAGETLCGSSPGGIQDSNPKGAPKARSSTPALDGRAGAAAIVFLLASLILVPAVAQLPQGFDQLAAEASAARLAGELPKAIDLYRQAVAVNPAWPEGWWYLGSLQYGANAYPEARDALTHFIDLTPAAGPATALRGLSEFEIGEYRQALNDVEAALAHGAATQSRNEHILRGHEALLLTRTGRYEDALRAYAFFARDGAPNPEMAVGIGLAALRTPLLPSDVSADKQPLYVAVGNALFHFMTGDHAGGKQAFDALFLAYPAVPNLHYIYGYYLFATDPDRAVAEFKSELEANPSCAAAEAILAWTAIMSNDTASARPYAQRAVADDPALPMGQLVLGRVLVDSGELAEGTAHLEMAVQLDPGNLENHLALARAYSEDGRKEDARRERLQSLAITRDGPLAHP